jgi:hypothetical protein
MATFRGSCLCGEVAFEVDGPFDHFLNCHCSRCRKATGSAHATNLYASPDRFDWMSGIEHVVRFDLPTAKSFATTFCRLCGSPLPHHTRSGRELVVPAGSLDDEPSLRPRARIFLGSDASWGCGTDDVPGFSEYPDWWRT